MAPMCHSVKRWQAGALEEDLPLTVLLNGYQDNWIMNSYMVGLK